MNCDEHDICEGGPCLNDMTRAELEAALGFALPQPGPRYTADERDAVLADPELIRAEFHGAPGAWKAW